MSTVGLGQQWLARLGDVLPDSSKRVRTRLAWHLARLDIYSDEQFARLDDAALSNFTGRPEQLVKLRVQYLSSVEIWAHADKPIPHGWSAQIGD